MEPLPNAESLIARSYDLNDRQAGLVQDITSRVNESLPNIRMFENIDPTEIQYIRLVVLAATRYYIDSFSRGDDDDTGELLVIPLPSDVETVFLVTRSTFTIVRLLYVHIMYNLSTNGVFTEYWTTIRPAVAFSVANGRDLFIHTELTLDNYQEVLDQSFEEAREQTVNQIYSEHHDHILHFSKEPEIERSDDNNDCNLCYLKADYVCEECKYPLCANCVRRIKTSNNTCPSCRHHPIILRRIKDGNFDIETEPNDIEEDDANNNINSNANSNVNSNGNNNANSNNTNNSNVNLNNDEPEVRDECIYEDEYGSDDSTHNNEEESSDDDVEPNDESDDSVIIDVIDHLQP